MSQVSVIIPAYNTAGYIGEALDSAFAQSFKDCEVIVINDGSPDTARLEKVLAPYLNRITYLKQENRGLSGARNAGIRAAGGKYLAFLDSDDIWLPDYLAEQVKFLETHPNVEVSIADAIRFGGPEGEIIWRMLKNGLPGILYFEQILRREGGQLPSASVARRQRVIEVGMFDEVLPIGEDVEFIARVCFPGRAIGYLGRALVKYRRHPGSLTGDPRNRNWQNAELQALRRLGESLPLSAAQCRLLDGEIAAAAAALALSDAYDHLAGHEFEKGAFCLRQANSYYHDPRITLALASLKAFPAWTARRLNRRRERSRTHDMPPGKARA
jgi:glycosyltransferase involved in cell wall biosynthesis